MVEGMEKSCEVLSPHEIKTAEAVSNKMKELQKRFPASIAYRIVYDTTPFIEESIREVFKALRDAIILVAIVVLVFLQNWRSALIRQAASPSSTQRRANTPSSVPLPAGAALSWQCLVRTIRSAASSAVMK